MFPNYDLLYTKDIKIENEVQIDLIAKRFLRFTEYYERGKQEDFERFVMSKDSN